MLALGCAGLVLPASATLNRLPSLGGSDVQQRQAQQSAGLNYLRILNRQGLTLQDPAITYYLEQSLLPLLPGYDLALPNSQLILFALSDPSFNAFALPGGLVGVHRGLLDRLDSTAELQAILAHELSHLALNHHQRLADSQQQSTALIIASFLLAPFTLQASPDATLGLLYGAQGLAIQRQLAFSRAMEEEADRIALTALRAGQVPLAGMVGAYETMASEQRRQTGRAGGGYPGTHPDVRARLTDLRNRIPHTPDAPTEETPALPLCWLQADLEIGGPSHATTVCARYARQPGESEPARQQRLLSEFAGNPYVLFRAARAVRQLDEPDQKELTESVLSHAALAPDSWLSALAVLQLLDPENPDTAAWLDTLAAGAPANDQKSWSTLARHYDARDERARALRAQAQVSWISGSVEVALRQIELAAGLSQRPSETARWRQRQKGWERLLDI